MNSATRSTYKQMDLAFEKENMERYRKLEQELAGLKKEKESFIARLRREYPEYASIRYPEPLRVKDLRLGPEEVLIEYEVTEKETFAWLIKGGKIIKTITIPIARKELTEQVKKYRGFFEGITSHSQLSRFDPRVGKELYDLLFKDLASFIKEGDRIILIPDEILGILPFETLVVELPEKVEIVRGRFGPYPQGVRYLGDVYPISYYQSATALTLARTLKKARAGKKEKLLVVADPVFDLADERLQGKKELMAKRDEYQMKLMGPVGEYWNGRQGGGPIFPRLATTGQLAERLKFYREEVDVLSGLAASEPELRKRPLREYRYQIFATHGILDEEVPYIKEPALVLSQVGINSREQEQDGFLTLSEVMGLELDAEIVALTACNTGVGKNLTGEGVMGMGRAFQYAGARAVLMSLWSVEDESTNLLTERFFTFLQGGKDELEALRLARSDLRKAGYEHPFFWAPFILVTPSPVPDTPPWEGTMSYGRWNVAVPLLACVGLLLLARIRLSELPAEVLGVSLPAPRPVPSTPAPMVPGKPASYARLVRRSSIDGVPQEITFTQDEILIGRGEECDVIIPHASISRQHVRVKKRKQGYVLFDLKSKRGTYVNGRLISENLLKEGWVVRLGEVEFVFYGVSPH